MKVEAIACYGGCKRTAATPEEARAKGWTLLPITGKYRCWDCSLELAAQGKDKTEEDKP